MGAAFGYWVTTDPLYPAQAVANSLAQGATPSASVSSTSYDTVTITFAEVDTATGGVEIPASDYVLQRYPASGGSPVTVTPSCSGTGMITCTESSVPDGTWQYTDTPTYAANWVGTESAKSGPVAVSTTATVSVTYPVDSTSYGADWSAMITGTASPGAGATVKSTQVAIEDTTTNQWWKGTSFNDATQNFVTANGTTTWLLGLEADNLTSGDSYSVVAQATDSAGNIGTSSTVAFTYGSTTTTTTPPTTTTTTATTPPTTSTTTTTTPPTTSTTTTSTTTPPTTSTTTTSTTTPPTTSTTTTTTPPTTTTTTATTPPAVSVTYPVDGATYGADWTGTITGTASSNSGASTTIASTQVAIEDTTADQWWNGTSFSASTQTFVPASGTTTWNLSLGSDNLTLGDSYSIVAQATDSASNVGTSSTVSFTYGSTTTTTTPPTTSTTTTTTPPTTSTTTTSLASA
jgi:hypothetical protein